MRQKARFFILNKKEDFGRKKGPDWENGELFWKGNAVSYYSRVFDSLQKGTIWHRISADTVIPNNMICNMTVYSSDLDMVSYGTKVYSVKELLLSDNDDKDIILSGCEMLKCRLEKDFLIGAARGRYMWFKLEIYSSSDNRLRLNKMRIEFSSDSWIKFLPEVYRNDEDGFLERYLGIFQSIYEDNERKIEKSFLTYTAENCDDEFLNWLCSWYCIQGKNLWSLAQLRYILKNAYRIYSLIGTRAVTEEISELYLGEKPLIIEYYQKDDKTLVLPKEVKREQVFINPYVFSVIIKGSNISSAELGNYKKILDSIKPVHMQANIIVTQNKRTDGFVIGSTVLSDDENSREAPVLFEI